MYKNLIVLCIIIASVVLPCITHAQRVNGQVNGRILSTKGPVDAATISLLRVKDSTLVKTTMADKEGHFNIEQVQLEEYVLSIESIGFQKYYSDVFELDSVHSNYTLQPVILNAVSKVLSDVVVNGKRPMIEQKLDKTIIHVDASPTNVGLTVLEVLEKSPGISVDKDGNISLKGKQGVLILIDGKPTYLSGADVANMLKNMPSNNLDQIEIMPNPPAKYDATGNSGVINIKTKKSKIKGMNGSVTIGAGQGIYPRTNNSTNINYRIGRINMFGSYSYAWRKNVQQLDISRNFRDANTNALESIFNQQAEFIHANQTHNYKIGVDYFVTPKTTFGIVINGFINPETSSASNTTSIYDATSRLQNKTSAKNTSNENWENFNTNLNFKHAFDSTGKEITIDMDYINYASNSCQLFNNAFYNDANVKIKSDENLRGNLPSYIKIFSGKLDLTYPLKENMKLDAGIKRSYVETDNNAQYDSLNTVNVWDRDASRSNHFLYRETINAAYMNLDKQINKKWNVQLGLRLENTLSNGRQLTTGKNFKNDYTKLFPTAYIGYSPNDKNQFVINYGRRIERPDYSDLNPFYYFIDKYTYEVGNPKLNPQFSNNIELTHTYEGFLTTSLSYSKTNNIITEVFEQIDSTNTTFIKKGNIAQRGNISLNISARLPITKWWTTNIYAQGFHSEFKGVVNNGYIEVEGSNFMMNIQNQFSFKKGWMLELSGFYTTGSLEGAIVVNSMRTLNFAVSKQVLKSEGTIRLNFKDFLNLQRENGYSRYGNVDLSFYQNRNNRIVNLSFTYRFNKGQKIKAQSKKSSAEEEQNRVKSDNNNP